MSMSHCNNFFCYFLVMLYVEAWTGDGCEKSVYHAYLNVYVPLNSNCDLSIMPLPCDLVCFSGNRIFFIRTPHDTSLQHGGTVDFIGVFPLLANADSIIGGQLPRHQQ